jgi:Asp-tRNA(Asn)/Glu-tRNA(Gln) amidotransferase C subunit
MTTCVGLPRAATWLRDTNPLRTRRCRCTRHAVSIASLCTRQFAVASPHRQSKDNLDRPIIPDLTHRPRIDLNKFLGSPGWKIDDLLPPNRHPNSTRLTPQPSKDASTPKSEISAQTLHHLLRLSALPQPSSPAEEQKLLAALHDQLHFVRHVQSVPTEDVPPLSRIGYEPRPDDNIGVLTFEECVEATKVAAEKAAAWKQWNVMDLRGGSRLGREEGYFVVVSKSTEPVEDEKKENS